MRTQSNSRTGGTPSLSGGFACFFVLEAVVKMLGLGVAAYFRDGWNKFDATIVGARRLLGSLMHQASRRSGS